MKVVFFVILAINLVFGLNEELVVRIKNGLLEGSFMETKNGRQFLGFMGIRYAKPPLDELRFQPPVPIEDWEGIKSATEVHDMCIQRNTFVRLDTIEGVEDCLFLNVYTPKINKDDLLPVMMFVHGGGYHAGAGNKYMYGPEVLLDKDVVLVSINYRLGPFGFFTTGDQVVPGNMGMKDQTLALQWIKENIVNFGGDPNSVTIFGESAGGGSTHLLMLSPLSKGLFHASISQSGTALARWALHPLKRGVNLSKKLAKIFKCPTDNSERMVKCLRGVDAKDIIDEQKQFLEWDIDPAVVFEPVIEPKLEGAFICETVENSLKMGLGSDVPWITGINTEEGAIRSAAVLHIPNLLAELNEKFEDIAHVLLFLDKSKTTDIIAKMMRAYYFKNGDIDGSREANLTNMYSDIYFASSLIKAIDLQKKYTKSPVYNYLFGYRGSMSFSEKFGGGSERNLGVCHADELLYLFPVYDLLFPGQYPTTDDKKMTEVMLTLWTNFAKYKNPTPDGSRITWSPVNSSANEYLHIKNDQNIIMGKSMYKERIDFWNTLEVLIDDHAADDELIVRVQNGELQGTYMETKRGRNILGFMGIPYAKPPVGDLRFEPPVPAENWSGVRPANGAHNVCFQNDMFSMLSMMKATESEDCLFLNVYTPKINKDELLPVMVFIHGGAFHCGSAEKGMIGPSVLLDKDIVMVAMNYRLGPLGFLATGDEVVPGNMGLKDQSLALKWVKENIINFGGDPNSITIFGVSAGGVSTHLQMLSPMSKGLFHRTISQSGTAKSLWSIQPLNRIAGLSKKLAKMLGCPTDNTKKMIDCLRKVDAKDINQKQKEFIVWDKDPIILFGPTIEPMKEGAFIADTPENILKNGVGSDVPWINGVTTEEGVLRSAAILTNATLLQEFNDKYDDIAHVLFVRDKSKTTDKLAKRLKEFYFGNGKIDESMEKELTNMYSDSLFTHGANQAVTLHKKYLRQPVYNYLFGFRGPLSISAMFAGTDKDFGVSHGDDMMYFFPMYDLLMPGLQLPKEHHDMADTFVILWTNFAKYGNPTPKGSEFIWNPVETESNEYLRINGPKNLAMEKDMFKERIDFWNSLEPLLDEVERIKDEL